MLLQLALQQALNVGTSGNWGFRFKVSIGIQSSSMGQANDMDRPQPSND
jgi:hypothetical protein